MERREEFSKQFDGCRTAKEIAGIYFGFYTHVPSRMEAFQRSILETPGMYASMKSKGYNENGEFMSLNQIVVIVEHWGLPNAVRKWLKAQQEAKAMPAPSA